MEDGYVLIHAVLSVVGIELTYSDFKLMSQRVQLVSIVGIAHDFDLTEQTYLGGELLLKT